MESIVIKFLRRCGVPAAARCNLIMVEAVRYVIEHPMSVYGGWYATVIPGIAKDCQCSVSVIESGIRKAIEYCYGGEDGGMVAELGLGIPGKPKTKTFVCRLAEVVKDELGRQENRD